MEQCMLQLQTFKVSKSFSISLDYTIHNFYSNVQATLRFSNLIYIEVIPYFTKNILLHYFYDKMYWFLLSNFCLNKI